MSGYSGSGSGLRKPAPIGTTGWAVATSCPGVYAMVSLGNCCAGSTGSMPGCGTGPPFVASGNIYYVTDTISYAGANDCTWDALNDSSLSAYTVHDFRETSFTGLAAALATADITKDLVIAIFNGSDYSPSVAEDRQAFFDWVDGGGRAIGSQGGYAEGYVNKFGASHHTLHGGSVPAEEIRITDSRLATGITAPLMISDQGGRIGGTVWFSTNPHGLNGCQAAKFATTPLPLTTEYSGAIIMGNTSRGFKTIYNGFLNDSFDDIAKGKQLYLNEIKYLFGLI